MFPRQDFGGGSRKLKDHGLDLRFGLRERPQVVVLEPETQPVVRCIADCRARSGFWTLLQFRARSEGAVAVLGVSKNGLIRMDGQNRTRRNHGEEFLCRGVLHDAWNELTGIGEVLSAKRSKTADLCLQIGCAVCDHQCRHLGIDGSADCRRQSDTNEANAPCVHVGPRQKIRQRRAYFALEQTLGSNAGQE